MFRKSSSVAFRAPRFGEVGGSSPSSSTNLRGGSIGKVCESKHSPLQDNTALSGKLKKMMRLVMSIQWETFGKREFESRPAAPILCPRSSMDRALCHCLSSSMRILVPPTQGEASVIWLNQLPVEAEPDNGWFRFDSRRGR